MRDKNHALVFAALGDKTRLFIITRLCEKPSCSISELTQGSSLTRQAVSKHLNILETAGIVTSRKEGRKNIFRLNPKPVDNAQTYLQDISQQWDAALSKLKAFVEQGR